MRPDLSNVDLSTGLPFFPIDVASIAFIFYMRRLFEERRLLVGLNIASFNMAGSIMKAPFFLKNSLHLLAIWEWAADKESFDPQTYCLEAEIISERFQMTDEESEVISTFFRLYLMTFQETLILAGQYYRSFEGTGANLDPGTLHEHYDFEVVYHNPFVELIMSLKEKSSHFAMFWCFLATAPNGLQNCFVDTIDSEKAYLEAVPNSVLSNYNAVQLNPIPMKDWLPG